MSQTIAPGKWDAPKRKAAKAVGLVVGAGLVAIGAWLGNVLIVNTLHNGKDITMWGVLLSLVPLCLGAAAFFPNIIVPLAYRIIDRIGKDAES